MNRLFRPRLRTAVVAGVTAAGIAVAIAGGTAGAAATKASATHQAAGKVKLVVWDYYTAGSGNPYGLWWNDVQTAFEKANPNITLKHTGFPPDGYQTRILGSLAGGSAPDVVSLRSDMWGAEFYRDMTQLDSRLTAIQKKQLLGLNSYVRSPYDNKLDAMPWGDAGFFFIYNKALFQKAGLNPAVPPTTFDQLLTACTKLNAQGIIPLAMGLKDGGWVRVLATEFAGRILSQQQIHANAAGTLNWTTTPGVSQAIQHVLAMSNHGCFGPKPETLSQQDGEQPFFSRTAAMDIAYPSYPMRRVYNALGGVANVGVMQLPIMPGQAGKQFSIPFVTNGWAIPKTSKNVDAAYKFISFISSPLSEQSAWHHALLPPNNTSVKIGSHSSDPITIKMVHYQLTSGNHLPFNVPGVQMTSMFFQLVPDLLTGRISVPDFVSQVWALHGH